MSTTTTATRTAPIHTVKVGDVIMPPKRELALWMRRTLAERKLPESALHLTVTAVREGAPDKGGRWLVVTTVHTAEWESTYPAENRGRPWSFKARPDTAWEFIGAAAPTESATPKVEQHTPGYRKTMASLIKPGQKDVVEWTEKAEWRVVAAGLSEHEATLLAAAPKLLAELKALLDFAKEYGPSQRADFEDWSGYFKSADEAIAEAEGTDTTATNGEG